MKSLQYKLLAACLSLGLLPACHAAQGDCGDIDCINLLQGLLASGLLTPPTRYVYVRASTGDIGALALSSNGALSRLSYSGSGFVPSRRPLGFQRNGLLLITISNSALETYAIEGSNGDLRLASYADLTTFGGFTAAAYDPVQNAALVLNSATGAFRSYSIASSGLITLRLSFNTPEVLQMQGGETLPYYDSQLIHGSNAGIFLTRFVAGGLPSASTLLIASPAFLTPTAISLLEPQGCAYAFRLGVSSLNSVCFSSGATPVSVSSSISLSGPLAVLPSGLRGYAGFSADLAIFNLSGPGLATQATIVTAGNAVSFRTFMLPSNDSRYLIAADGLDVVYSYSVSGSPIKTGMTAAGVADFDYPPVGAAF
ncbi:MAG: hypothetical protein K1X75_16700 [Leptospirales bacterium]|nr:hypothetical protein [Leptospirales bacterium]